MSTISQTFDLLIDLSPQQRNLLLMRPLLSLEETKNRFSDPDVEGASLLAGVDTQYLSLTALNYMMEGSAMGEGYTQTDVVEYLADVVLAMQPGASLIRRQRISEIVVDSLDNAGNDYLPHSYEYFDAPSGEMRRYEFRLTTYEPDFDDTYRYRPTPEGYLVLLGMLDLKVEDYQILVEKMLQLLIERGRYEQAYEFARRARLLSIEHRQQILEFIDQARRAPGAVDWRRDIAPRLSEARIHVRARQDEDRQMEEAVRNQLGRASDVAVREHLVRLFKVLHSAGTLRARLQGDVVDAGAQFMNAQAGAFRPRRPSAFPDLATNMLPDVLSLPRQALCEGADDILLSFYPPVFPKTPDLSDLLSVLLERHVSDAQVTVDPDEGELISFEEYADPFPDEVAEMVHSWLNRQFSTGQSLTISELIALAAGEGYSPEACQYIVYVLYRSFPDSESLFQNVRASKDGTFFSDVAQGDDLRFDPKRDVNGKG